LLAAETTRIFLRGRHQRERKRNLNQVMVP
jgi:hypothetical protein